MCFQDSSETCTSPSTPPRSTNAPKLTIEDTTPGRTWPFCSVCRKVERTSDCVCSSQARRDRTTLLRFLSSSMILASISLPTYGWRSRTRRISTSDAGRKPRRPMSRMRPPLTTSMTVPVTTPSSSLIFSIVPQARSYCARFLDRISRPSLSSFWRTRASTCVADLDNLAGVDVVLDGQLTGGDDALGLVADVEQDLVAVDLDDGALDDVAVVEVLDGGVDRGEEVLGRADVVDRDLRGGGLRGGGDAHVGMGSDADREVVRTERSCRRHGDMRDGDRDLVGRPRPPEGSPRTSSTFEDTPTQQGARHRRPPYRGDDGQVKARSGERPRPPRAARRGRT